MGGEVKTILNDSENGDALSPFFHVRFGFRQLMDGRVCVAAFGPDLEFLPKTEQSAWSADLIESPTFASNDAAFDRWNQRYLHGSWSSENGPIQKLEHEIELIKAMTRFDLNEPLFHNTHNPALRYPIAENSEAFTLAILELFRLVIDGLSLKGLKAIASKLKKQLPTLQPGEKRGTMNTLKTLLPESLISTIHEPLKVCSIERNKLHGVPSQPAQAFAAFKEFNRQISMVQAAIERLRKWIEQELALNGEICLRREEAMSYFPKFDGPLRPEYKEKEFQKAVGKTITKVETGEIIPGKGCHRREAIVFHFSDGTALAIDVGSNAGNFEHRFEGFDSSLISADLMPKWAGRP